MTPVLAAALAFAPPLDTVLRYDIIERRPGKEGESRYTLHEEVRFVPDRDGYLLTMRATGYELDAPPARRAMLDATMKPIVDLPIRIRLSAGGVPESVIDGAGVWAVFVAGMRTRASSTKDPALARIADALAAMPAHARDAQLIENADYVVAPHLPPIAIGQTIADGDATVSRTTDRDGAAQFHRATERPAPGDAGRLAIDEDVVLRPDTGLVARRLRTVRLRPATGGAMVPVSTTETVMVK